MTTKRSIFTTALVITSIVFMAATFYFGWNLYYLKSKFSEYQTEHETTRQSEQTYNRTSKEIDSLILKEDYTAAQALLKELKSPASVRTDFDLRVRRKLLSDLIKARHGKESVSKETSLYNSSLSDDFKTKYNLPKDSLINALTKAESQIALLRKRLGNTSENEYLTFHTSKGTSLHYVGQVKKHKAHGFGIALLETGSRYEGSWKNNMRHGQGKFYWDDGEHYEGGYVNDKREGMGTYFWKNGEKYVGEWKDDRRNGQGKFFNKKGKVKAQGIWENDKLVKEDK